MGLAKVAPRFHFVVHTDGDSKKFLQRSFKSVLSIQSTTFVHRFKVCFVEDFVWCRTRKKPPDPIAIDPWIGIA